ncbi:MAG: TetR family transcriptional regulator [Actinomycetia bacterium]|nr:TetR family transcriptional regulator [Actinomycetes bacterium]MCP4226165.1 TetR family transcriptional regulator [Actinomycetes bacterium]MCP5034446.1 TetR family transcriptional regulator [Actinomycetes bacterium]
MGERKSSRSGLETRDRIIDAALDTVRVEGLVGTSVRAIARTGGFNQALVFYHFGRRPARPVGHCRWLVIE